MSRNVLISSIGWTPAVITEIIDLLEERGIPIHEVVVFPTKDVLPSYYALLIDFKYGPYKGEKRIEKCELPFTDIKDEKDCEEFRRIVENVITKKIEEGKNVIVSVAGGRKTMPLDMMIVAKKNGIKEIYHVIAEEKKGISNEFAAIQRIFNLKNIAEGREDPPKQIVDFIVGMCHPRDLTLRLIRIPIEELK